MKIFDCFLFFNELDLLHIRLEMLYDYVDYFIISECDSTFSGLDKPFYFEENRHIFKKYENKIIYLKHYNSKNIDNINNIYTDKKRIIFDNILSQYYAVKNTAITGYGMAHWCREVIHKEYITLGMDICDDDDVIMFSDLDEIPNPLKFIFDDRKHVLKQHNISYYINKQVQEPWWNGGMILKYKDIKNNSICHLRNNSRTSYNAILDAGWHLTHMGGKDRVIQKIKSWGHQEFNTDNIISNVQNNISNNRDIFNRNINIIDIDINGFYPEKMITFIKENYSYLIK